MTYALLLMMICAVPPVLLNFTVFSWRSKQSFGDTDVWLGFFGNYSGGIIGALVALFILTKNKPIERNKNFITDTPMNFLY